MSLPLSVILATTEPWPDLANCLAVLEPQVLALGGEILVGDGHGDALDPERTKLSHLRWIRLPGASVFALRARAMELAQGEIIATTEDHCLVGADWCAQIVEAFARHPQAMAVHGPVLNGSTERLIDRANFFQTFGSFLPSSDPERWSRCPPNANVAYRRSAVPPGSIAAGWMELELNPRLFGAGLFTLHQPMTVLHVQSMGFWGTLRTHFDNGRSTTGLHPAPFSRRQLPWNVYRASLRTLGRDRVATPEVRQALPLLFLLSCCHALGETMGILFGPGKSPARLR